MITKKEAYDKVKKYIEQKRIRYIDIFLEEKVTFIKKEELRYTISYGKYKDIYRAVFIVHFSELWGLEERSMGTYIDAETGEILYTITPNGYLDL